MKKIVVIGGTGTIGKEVVSVLRERHEVLPIGSSSGDFQCDLTSSASIEHLFSKIGNFDHLICAAGKIHFSPLSELTEEDFYVGIQSKLMGQVNLVRLGMQKMNESGSFTLTSGILSRDPIASGTPAAMTNAAIEGFVKGAAIELPKGLRINCVSPTILKESYERLEDYFRGYVPVPAWRVAQAYVKSVEGAQTGQVYHVDR